MKNEKMKKNGAIFTNHSVEKKHTIYKLRITKTNI